MRPPTSFETPIAGVVNGVTFFSSGQEGGLTGLEGVGWPKMFFAAFLSQCGKLCTGRISAFWFCFGNIDVQNSFRWEICEERAFT
jgi:hypothetical protein